MILFAVINNIVNTFDNTISQIKENFTPIRTVKRSFYPRNFQLSEEFVQSFKREYKRLIDEGIDSNKALNRITKALLFHVRD
jgi:hypothetical protein